MREQVEIDLGPRAPGRARHDRRPGRGRPSCRRCCGAPHGHDEAVAALRGMIDVMLLDSDDMPRRRPRGSRAREEELRVRVRRRPRVAAHDAVARAAGGELRPARRAGRRWRRSTGSRPPPVELDRERAAARRLARLAPALGDPAAGGGERRRPAWTGVHRQLALDRDRARARPSRKCPGLAGVTVACERVRAVAGPRPRAACARTRRSRGARRAQLAGARSLARRGRDPRRGRPAGAAARSHLRPGARRCAEEFCAAER